MDRIDIDTWTHISAEGWSSLVLGNGASIAIHKEFANPTLHGIADAKGLLVDNAKSDTLMPVIKQKIMPDSIVYTDSLSSYDKLDLSGFIHHRINHSKEFADRRNHINGIENFWNQAKRVLRKYNGIDRKSFPLFLKECEFRFNFGTPSQ